MLKKIFTATTLTILIFTAFTIYYYVKTSAAAIVVSCDDLPDSLSKIFSPDAVVDRVVDHLTDIVSSADSGVNSEGGMGMMEMLGPRPVAQKVPIRASSTIPVFNQKFKGVDLNFTRRLGMYLKTTKSLELRAVGASQGGWRLIAVLKERPDDLLRQTGNAPRDGAQCSDYESCAKDVAEQSLETIDPARLLNYYIKLDTKESNRRILQLHQNKLKAKLAEDFVAWGNAFYALGFFNDALQKYQEALAKDKNSCAAQLARGFLYYGRPHGKHTLADLAQAEQDFRSGVACAPSNKFAQTDLCNVLIRESRNRPGAQVLMEGLGHCKDALAIDSRFVPAAINIAYGFYQQGKHDEAITYFKEIAQQYPTDSSLFLNYGYCLYLEYLAGKNDALDDAIEKTEQAIMQNPASYTGANNLGFFYYDKGNYEKALEYWEKADPLRGDDVDALAGRALALFKIGHRQEASSFINQSIKLNAHYSDPNFVQANYAWSRRAAADLSELIANLPPRVDTEAKLAKIAK